jgi:transposase-like protein
MAEELDGIIAELAARMLRETKEEMAAAPPEAVELAARATERVAESLEEWLRLLQEQNLLPPLSRGGRRLVVTTALLAAKLLHSLAGELKLAGAPESLALAKAAGITFSPPAKLVLAAALEALGRAISEVEEGGGC